jgi:predicted GNAT family acetyltransferase
MGTPFVKGSAMKTRVRHYEDQRRFEVQSEGYTAYLTYILRGRIMDIVHTYVPRPIRDRGIAAALVEAAYNYALEEKYICQATCPYARTWLNENR